MNDKGMWGAEEAQWQQTAQGVDKNFGKIKGNLGPLPTTATPTSTTQQGHETTRKECGDDLGMGSWGWNWLSVDIAL